MEVIELTLPVKVKSVSGDLSLAKPDRKHQDKLRWLIQRVSNKLMKIKGTKTNPFKK